jgi:phytol kinase
LAAAGGYAWVKVFDRLAASGGLDRKLSRKLVHATAGPLLVLTWPLFSGASTARLVAAAVPALNALRLALVGSGALHDRGLVASVSRAGGRGELLKGPLYYVIVLSGLTAAFWRDLPAPALVAVAMMCGGDGLADIVGRRFGKGNPLPWNAQKSWAGSAAMAFGGMLMAGVMMAAFQVAGWDVLGVGGAGAGGGGGEGGEAAVAAAAALFPRLLAICLACTAAESLPANRFVDDNLSVPAVAVAGSLLLLPAPAAAAAAGAGGGLSVGALAIATAGVAAAVGAAGAVASATAAGEEDDEDDGAGGGVEAVSSSLR